MMMKKRKKKIKGYRTKYAGSQGKGVIITLPFDPRKGICEACGKSVKKKEIKYTQLHHWRYAYKPATVKKNPMLVLENTSELCYYCHKHIADPIRALLYASPPRIAKVVRLLDPVSRKKFIKRLETVVMALKETENNINPLAIKIMKRMTENGKKE